MKNANGKELLRGDLILAPDGQGDVIAGRIGQFYERSGSVLVSGNGVPIKADKTVLAIDAYHALIEKDKPESNPPKVNPQPEQPQPA